MFFVEITILSMLFSQGGGGVNWVLKNFADPVPLSKFLIPLELHGSIIYVYSRSQLSTESVILVLTYKGLTTKVEDLSYQFITIS